MVAAAQVRVTAVVLATVVDLLDQSIAVEGVKVQARQVGGEDPQQFFLLSGLQPVVQPQRLVGRGSVEFVEFEGAELVAVAFGTYIAQLQAGLIVKQYRPSTALFGRSREQAEQGQQADGETNGNPEPTQDEIPS
ncbi:hypothetical protein D3C81_996930 [compost metagenome]